MPRKKDKSHQSGFTQGTAEQNQMNSDMEIEDLNEESRANKIIEKEDDVPDLTDIEKEEIEDNNGNKYYPDKFSNCFRCKNDLAKEMYDITLKFILAKKKYNTRQIKIIGPKEVYIINKSWYNNWKKFSRYSTMKRIIKDYGVYEKRPIEYKPEKKNLPGIINNEDLLIRNKIGKNGRNILVSKKNECLDTKLKVKKDFKLLAKERFDLLNNYFHCDRIIKAKRVERENESKNYNIFCVHLNLIFLPTLAMFKEVNDENIERFKKNQNIIYDVYFKQSASRDDIYKELEEILIEKPEILNNMGVEIIMKNDKEVMKNHIQNFKFFVPNSTNKKSAKEMMDFIFSNETIEKLKKDEKIPENEINLLAVQYFADMNGLLKINWLTSKDNIDEKEGNTIFIEYNTLKDHDTQHLGSIFDIQNNVHFTITNYESPASRVHHSPQNSPHHAHHPNKDYNLEDFPLNKEENKHGLVGLNNLGNTCYMNTGLQCLSNCELLTKYFLEDYYKEFINKDNPIGSQGDIVEKYSQIIHHIWYGDKDCIMPIQFKNSFGKMYAAFNDFRQQDSQEFISYLLDALHEDLNKVLKKPYIATKDLPENISEEEQFKIKKDIYLCRNQSFIADLIYGFYKSTVYCPDEKCKNVIKSFEPFSMITLSLVNEAQIRKMEEEQNEQNKKLGIKIITITFIPFKIINRPLRFPMKIKKDMDVFSFKKKVETITGFNENSFEIYKMQSTEFLPIKPEIYLLEEFLKGENKLFLFQIPPYVFEKPLDYFDKAYDELKDNPDKLYLEEEKYEGNDLYSEYNKKEKKSKTTDDLENNANKLHMDEEDEKAKGKDEEKKMEEEKKDDEETKEEEENKNKIKDDEDIEMKDVNLNIDKSKWVKAEFYNYSYSNEKNKKQINEEYRLSNSRIVYLNKEWDNSQVYVCILEMLEGAREDLNEIKESWFSNLKEETKNLEKFDPKKENIYDKLDNTPHYPLLLQYLSVFNFNKDKIMTKKDGWKNIVFPFDSERYIIKKVLENALKNSKIEDLEILFKIIWKKEFASDYNEVNTPIELEKSEKLEDIFNKQKEDKFLRKDNTDTEKGKKGKKKKLKIEELLNNFNEIEKLSKDNQWKCPKCDKMQLADKKMEIYSVSEVVIIHLKRFRNNRKIENLVEFPIEGLDLSAYLPKKDENNIYDLFAVANHSGGLHGGHYYAYCKNCVENEWYEFNDSHVSKIDAKSVVSENAYVLFYKKRRNENEKLNEEELFKKPFIQIDYSKYT